MLTSDLSQARSYKPTSTADRFSKQYKINAIVPGVIEPVKVVFCSASREDTSFEVFDANGQQMAYASSRYASQGNLLHRLTKELNALCEIEEWDTAFTADDLREITDFAVRACEGRYGNGNSEGDVVLILHKDPLEPVKLYVRTEPDGDNTKVIGEARRGDKVLHSIELVTDDTPESVGGMKELVGLQIELWAVKNTDFMPEPDRLPQ